MGNTVAKLCAALLVALVILPNTAPFRTLVVADALASRHADAVVGALTAHPSVADPDDDDALLQEQSNSLQQLRLCALIAVASYEAAAVFSLFRPAVAPTTVILSLSPLKTVLRL
jgi:hypothetical protein